MEIYLNLPRFIYLVSRKEFLIQIYWNINSSRSLSYHSKINMEWKLTLIGLLYKNTLTSVWQLQITTDSRKYIDIFSNSGKVWILNFRNCFRKNGSEILAHCFEVHRSLADSFSFWFLVLNLELQSIKIQKKNLLSFPYSEFWGWMKLTISKYMIHAVIYDNLFIVWRMT